MVTADCGWHHFGEWRERNFMITFNAHSTPMMLLIIILTITSSISPEALCVCKDRELNEILKFLEGRKQTNLRRYHVMRDATKVCVQEPIEERIPKAITQCEPCDDEIKRWRNLNSILRGGER
jgi:hypothetical protein